MATVTGKGFSCIAGVLFSIIFLISCNRDTPSMVAIPDPLPSWNQGATKTSILTFVDEATDPDSPDYIDVPDRVAVFDNDGTLWSEKPAYFQLFFAMDRVRALAPGHPEWKDQQPYKAVLENDLETLAGMGEHGILEIVMATHTGITTDEFEEEVTRWITTARHPTLNRLYTDLVFQPMLELMDLLRQNQFKVFIVSGGGIDFMRPWVEGIYGIPRDQVVGSSGATEYIAGEGSPRLIKKAEIDFINDKEGKPVGIHRFIGRKPVFAAGNSDGDLAMLQWTASGPGKRFMLYVHHTDGDREWAYDRESSVGRLDKGLDEALQKGWTVMDMKRDWRIIYPFQLNKDIE